MIGKEEFIEFMQSYQEQSERVDKLNELFHDSFGDPIIYWGFKMFANLVNCYFTKEGVDWIDYYLYENPEKRYYQDDVEIPLETLNDLWKVVKDYRK